MAKASLRESIQIGGAKAGPQGRRFELDASPTWNRIHRRQLASAGDMLVIARDSTFRMARECWPAVARAVDFGEDSRRVDKIETAQRLTA